MRPTVLEILRGARYNIDEVIVPDLRSEWAGKTARLLRALIEYLIILHEHGPEFLSRDNERLRQLAEDVEGRLSRIGSPAADQALQRMRAALGAPRPPHDEHVCIDELMAENERLRAAVDAALLPPEDMPGNEDGQKLSASIQRALAAQASDEFALVEPLMGLLRGR